MSDSHGYVFQRSEQDAVWIGDYGLTSAGPLDTCMLHVTSSKSEAECWLRDLHAGRQPDLSDRRPSYLHPDSKPLI
jgi:hypothetical protein